MKHLRITALGILMACVGIAIAGKQTELKDNPGDQVAEPRQAMTNGHLQELIKRIDPQAQGESGYWVVHYDAIQVQVVTDEKADRMRIMTAVARSNKGLDSAILYRMLQANFDSALDARYAIANEQVWSVFSRP